jgi:hypothetical protein
MTSQSFGSAASTSHATSRVERVVPKQRQEPPTHPQLVHVPAAHSYEHFSCFRTYCRDRACLNYRLKYLPKLIAVPLHNAPSIQNRDFRRSESETRSAASEHLPSPSRFDHAPSRPTISRIRLYPSALSLGHSSPSPFSTLRRTIRSRRTNSSLRRLMYSKIFTTERAMRVSR